MCALSAQHLAPVQAPLRRMQPAHPPLHTAATACDPVPLGLARRPPSQHGQTSPPRVSRTWSCQPSRVGPPGAVSSAVCVCPPPMGSPSVDSQTVRASQHSRSQQLHHLGSPCLYRVGCSVLSSFPVQPIRPSILSYSVLFGYIIPGSQACT